MDKRLRLRVQTACATVSQRLSVFQISDLSHPKARLIWQPALFPTSNFIFVPLFFFFFCRFWFSTEVGREVKWKSLSHVQVFATPWTIQSMYTLHGLGQKTGVGSLSFLQGIFPGIKELRNFSGSQFPPLLRRLNWGQCNLLRAFMEIRFESMDRVLGTRN